MSYVRSVKFETNRVTCLVGAERNGLKMEILKGLGKGLGYGLIIAPALYLVAFLLNVVVCFCTCGLHGCFESCGPDSLCFHECGGDTWDPRTGQRTRIEHGQNTCFPAGIWNWEAFGIGIMFSTIAGAIIGSIYGVAQQVQHRTPGQRKERAPKPIRTSTPNQQNESMNRPRQ